MKPAAVSVLSVFLAAGSAASARDAGQAPAVASFEGACFGLGLGAANSRGMTEYPILSGGTTCGPFDSVTGKSLSAFAGWNFQRGNIVFGGAARSITLVDVSDQDPSVPEGREVRELAGTAPAT